MPSRSVAPEDLVAAILASADLGKVAGRVGATVDEVRVLLAGRELREALFAAQSASARATCAALHGASADAVETLRRALTSPGSATPAQVSAARAVLGAAQKARAEVEFDDRLDRMRADLDSLRLNPKAS